MKKYNTKNLIISTFLRGWRMNPPFCFWNNDKVFKTFEPEIKEHLHDSNSTIFIAYEDGPVTPYGGGNFDLLSDKPCAGWLITKKPNQIISYMVLTQFRRRGLAKKMLIRGAIHLDQPRNFILVYPTQALFVCAHKSLRDVGRVSTKVNQELNPYKI